MKNNITKYYYLVLLFISPLLLLFLKNINNTYPVNFLSSFVLFFFLPIFLIIISSIFFEKKFEKIILFCFLFWFLQFFVGYLKGIKFPFISEMNLKITFLIFILLLSFLLSYFLNKYIKNFIIIFLVLNFLYVGFSNERIFVKTKKQNNITLSNQKQFSKNENFYFLMLDQMTSQELFLKDFNFDMKNYINYFQKKKYFLLSESKTNNLQTIHVLSSLFNLSDDQKFRNKFVIENKFSNNLPLINILDFNDYNLWYLDNDVVECPMHRSVKCILNAKSSLINSPIYHLISVSIFNKIYVYVLHEYLTLFKKKGLYSDTEIDKFITFAKNNFKIIESKKNFFFIHNMGPHHPYRDKNCNIIAFDYRMSKDEKLDYISSTKCVLKKITKLIDHIDKYDKNSFVIIQGDHGFSIDNELNKRKKDIFNLVKVPNRCKKSLKKNLNNVDTLKIILNCI